MAAIVAGKDAKARALALIEAGEVVAIPTETVYGLAGDATNGVAIARIFEVKGRPRFNPLIAHVVVVRHGRAASSSSIRSRSKLAEAFWPGPLTLVLPLRPGARIHPLVTAGLDTIALRMPKGFGAELIAALGRPLAAPSANSSGRVSATTAAGRRSRSRRTHPADRRWRADRRSGWNRRSSRSRAASSGCCRPGGIAAEEIEASDRQAACPRRRGGRRGAGHAGLALCAGRGSAARRARGAAGRGAARLRADRGRWGRQGRRRRSTCRRAAICAKPPPICFSMIQSLDRTGAATIAVAPIPDHGLGEAINDRLRAPPHRVTCRSMRLSFRPWTLH